MSLWTPYAQEAALDLSLSAPVVKQEQASPLPASTAPDSPSRPGVDPSYFATYPYPPVTYTVPPMYPVPPTYQVPPAYPVPTTYYAASSTCPDSNGSWSHSNTNAPSTSESPDFNDIISLDDDVEYQEFERDALQALAEKNGGTLLGNNPRMRRAVQTSQTADDSYRKQRERNNYAAKQSRDRRKLREVRLSLQVSYLKKKMAVLQARLSARVCSNCE